MKEFSLILSPSVSNETKIKVWELCKNGKNLFQFFIQEVEKDNNLLGSIAAAVRIIETSSNLFHLPKTKFRLIEGHKLSCKVYEAKAGIIRVYLFHEEKTGRVIVLGGKKEKQTKDIKSVIKIIKSYYDEKG